MEKFKPGELIVNEDKLEFDQVQEYFSEQKNNPMLVELTVNKTVDYDKIKENFEKIKRKDRPNLYALCVRKENTEWEIKYIGQRKSEGILERLKQHLFAKNEKTGSKLDNIKKELKNGSEIGLILYKVSPDALRQYYEQKLIEHFKPGWNIQS